MDIKVTDLQGDEKDFEYAQSKYGVAFRRAEVAPGQKVYRLIELQEKTGHHSLITQVLDEDGQPIDQIDVAFYWVDAPDPPDPPTNLLAHDWYRNFVHGVTNANGEVGPGMGTGAYHGEGEGGPHAVWVRDPSIPSDICEKLGMLAGTFHDHLDQKFQLLEGEYGQGKFVEIYRTVTDNMEGNHIGIYALGAANFAGTEIRLIIGDNPTDPDFIFPDAFYPIEDDYYNIGAEYHPGQAEERRTFWAIICELGGGKVLSDPLRFDFRTGIRTYHRVDVRWQAEGEPPPEPPPEPPDEPPDEPPAWAMSIERRPGRPLLIGIGLPPGTPVVIKSPWGHQYHTVAGTKLEYGSGGWEVNIWHPATYRIEFLLEEGFDVEIGEEVVIVTFEQGAPPTQWRLVSKWISTAEVETLLQKLENAGIGEVFSIEEN